VQQGVKLPAEVMALVLRLIFEKNTKTGLFVGISARTTSEIDDGGYGPFEAIWTPHPMG
jgi:hypothetical protein